MHLILNINYKLTISHMYHTCFFFTDLIVYTTLFLWQIVILVKVNWIKMKKKKIKKKKMTKYLLLS